MWEECACKTRLRCQHTGLNSKLPFQGGFIFFMHSDHIFTRQETGNIKNLSMCYHQLYLNCIQGLQCLAFLFGGTSQEIFALTRGLSCHGWLLSIQGKHLGETMQEQERGWWLQCQEITLLPLPLRCL